MLEGKEVVTWLQSSQYLLSPLEYVATRVYGPRLYHGPLSVHEHAKKELSREKSGCVATQLSRPPPPPPQILLVRKEVATWLRSLGFLCSRVAIFSLYWYSLRALAFWVSPNKIFMFLINPPSGNVKIQKMIAKHIFECFEKRKGEDGKATLGLN